MQSTIDDIKQLYADFAGDGSPITGIEKIPQSGSNRNYFRILTKGDSYIACSNDNIRENKTFIHYSRHFRSQGCPVPEIFAINEAYTIYIQEDFGDQSLLKELEKEGHNDRL